MSIGRWAVDTVALGLFLMWSGGCGLSAPESMPEDASVIEVVDPGADGGFDGSTPEPDAGVPDSGLIDDRDGGIDASTPGRVCEFCGSDSPCRSDLTCRFRGDAGTGFCIQNAAPCLEGGDAGISDVRIVFVVLFGCEAAPQSGSCNYVHEIDLKSGRIELGFEVSGGSSWSAVVPAIHSSSTLTTQWAKGFAVGECFETPDFTKEGCALHYPVVSVQYLRDGELIHAFDYDLGGPDFPPKAVTDSADEVIRLAIPAFQDAGYGTFWHAAF